MTSIDEDKIEELLKMLDSLDLTDEEYEALGAMLYRGLAEDNVDSKDN